MSTRIGIHCLFCLSVWILPLSANANAIEWGNPGVRTHSEIALLKEFIRRPPVSGEIDFEFTSSFLPGSASAFDTHGGRSVLQAYRAVWRGADYYIVRLAVPDFSVDAMSTNAVEMAGLYKGKPWYYALDRGVLSISEDSIENSVDADVLSMHRHFGSRYVSARSLGLLHAVGSLEWNGDDLNASAYDGSAEMKGRIVEGQTSGRPAELSFFGMVGNQRIGGKITYVYAPKTTEISLPQSYVVRAEIGTNTFPFSAVGFRAIRLTNMYSEGDFAPRAAIANLLQPPVVLITSNSTKFHLTKDSRLERVIQAGEHETAFRRRAVIGLMVFITLSACLVGWKLSVRHVRQQP